MSGKLDSKTGCPATDTFDTALALACRRMLPFPEMFMTRQQEEQVRMLRLVSLVALTLASWPIGAATAADRHRESAAPSHGDSQTGATSGLPPALTPTDFLSETPFHWQPAPPLSDLVVPDPVVPETPAVAGEQVRPLEAPEITTTEITTTAAAVAALVATPNAAAAPNASVAPAAYQPSPAPMMPPDEAAGLPASIGPPVAPPSPFPEELYGEGYYSEGVDGMYGGMGDPGLMPGELAGYPYPYPHCQPGEECRRCDPCCEPWYRLFDFGIHTSTCGDPGIGQERVMLAPFFLGTTQPFNNVRLQFDSVWGVETPNRSEYYWAAPPKGPELPERELDYFDLRLVSELAPSKSFSITTAVPMRSLDPEINPNTTGLGDMSVATKLVLLDGRYWQFTQLFKTHINTGSPRKGLGTGHVSLEPGILGRYEWNPRLFFHGRLSFWIPIGGDRHFSGPAVNYGLGASYVAYETDTFAVLPTVEMMGWSFLDGMKTLPNGEIVDVDDDGSVAFLPGTRFVLGPAGDLGLFEVGLAGGFAVGNDGWYDSIFRTELRWSY